MFQNWLMLQAAGERYLNGYVDVTGAERWQVDAYAERRIKGMAWAKDDPI